MQLTRLLQSELVLLGETQRVSASFLDPLKGCCDAEKSPPPGRVSATKTQEQPPTANTNPRVTAGRRHTTSWEPQSRHL